MKRRTVFALVALAALLVAAVLLARRFVSEAPPDPDQDLRAALLAARAELEWPGLDVKTAARELGSRERAVAFVKDEIASASYSGSWQGAEGTLRTRVANAADRAVLLAALLRELGLEARLARGDWPAWEKAHEPSPPDRAIAATEHLLELVGAHGAAPETAPVDTLALSAEVSAAVARLEPLAGGAFTSKHSPAPRKGEPDWVWVQVKKGEGWEDVDVVFPAAKRPAVVRAPWEPAATRVAFEVDVVDSEERRHGTTRFEGPASAVIGRGVGLTLLPGTCRIDELDRLETPDAVKLWVPCLQVGAQVIASGAFSREGVVLQEREGAISLEGASEPIVRGAKLGEATPAPGALESVELAGVDVRHYPRVHVQARVRPVARVTWRAGEVRAADEKGPLPVLVESENAGRRPVLLLLDVSESMREEARLVLAKKALHALVERLEPEQPVALVVFSSFPRVLSKVAPLRACKEELLRQLDAVEPSPGTALVKATDDALAMSAEPATIVLVTDGEDSGKSDEGYPARVEKLLASLRASKHLVLPIGIGEADDLLLARIARGKSAPYLRIGSGRDLPRIEDALSVLGSELVGGLRFSFVARDGAPGSEQVVRVKLAGASQELAVKFTVPPAPPRGSRSRSVAIDRVELAVVLHEEGREPRRLVHTVARLDGGPADPWRLLAAEHVGIAVGASPSRTLLARRVDDALDLLAVRRLGATGEPPAEHGAARGWSGRAALVAALSVTRLRAVVGAAPVRGAGPFVFVERARWERRGEDVVRRTDLDFLAPPLAPADDATVKDRLAVGLALATVEASLLETESVNARLLAATDLEANARDGGVVVSSRALPGLAWVVAPAGDVRVLLDDAKGASADEAARKFKEIRSLLKLMGSLGKKGLKKGGVPYGSLFVALCTYFDRLMQYWCYSSVMLGLVSEGIEAGKFDAGAAEKEAAKLCELEDGPRGMGKKLADALGGGLAKGTYDDAKGAATGAVKDAVKEALGF